jgi:hypothetical protein
VKNPQNVDVMRQLQDAANAKAAGASRPEISVKSLVSETKAKEETSGSSSSSSTSSSSPSVLLIPWRKRRKRERKKGKRRKWR